MSVSQTVSVGWLSGVRGQLPRLPSALDLEDVVTRVLHDYRIVPHPSLVSSGPTSCCPQRFFTSERIRASVLFTHDALRMCPLTFVEENAVLRVVFPFSAQWREPGERVH